MSPRVIDHASLQARERELLAAALEIIRREGAAALTMDKVVARVPYSKGTVYNHFSGKEDLLTGLCNQSMQRLLRLFQRVLTFSGSSREKMLAICFAYMLFAQLYPDRFMLVITAKTPSVSEKASQKRQSEHLALDAELLGVAIRVINEAQSRGELTLPAGRRPEQVAFSLWAMTFGTIALLSENVERCSARSALLMEQEVVNHSNLVLDGLGWQPASSTERTLETISRCKLELFAEEVARLGERGKTLAV